MSHSDMSNMLGDFSDPGRGVKAALFKETPIPRLIGAISICFGPYMPQVMESEEVGLRESILISMQEESFDPKDTAILASSIRMFHNIKVKYTRCLSIDAKETLYALSKVFKNIVVFYAESLAKHYP